MNVGSLFSGIGGIDKGFEQEGFKTKWFVENDLYCQAVLKKHWPAVPVYGDITQIDFTKLEPVDILTGGFPCQDISVAGKRKGITGQRSGLWKEYARSISEIRPKIVVVENVPNLVNLGLDEVLADITALGYDCEWGTIRASDFGAPHRRERIFIIAYFNQFNGRGLESNDNESRYLGKIEKSFIAKERGLPRIFSNNFRQRIERFKQETFQRQSGFSWCKNIRSVEEFKGRPDIPQPLVWGTHHGLSNRIHRTKSLGNAVVPQVAQFIARQIKENGE